MKKFSLADTARRFKGVLFAAVMLVFFALVIYFTKDIRLLVVNTTVDARFWPRIIGWSGCFLSVLLLIQSVAEGAAHTWKENAETEPKPSAGEAQKSGARRTLAMLALIFLYILGLEPFGFVVMTLLYLFFQFLVLADKRNPKRLALITVLFTAIVYVLFRYVFQMMLPAGTVWANLGGLL